MSIKLRELIRNIRTCKTAAEERSVVSKECAAIRTSFKEDASAYRHRNVAKLLFINMLGYPTHFGQLECLKLIASSRFSDKRLGYLGLTLLLDEATEVLMLVINSIKNDLSHQNQYVTGLALCALGNIGNQEMSRSLCREVEFLLDSPNPYVRKKAALCALRMIRRVEDIEERFTRHIEQLLLDKSHGVVLGGSALLLAVLEQKPQDIGEFTHLVPQLVRVLKGVLTAGYSYASEYDISGITDPFLQCALLRLLRVLSKDEVLSDELNDVLAEVCTNTEGTKNVGNAILYECVQTVIHVQAESGLRVLAINILGRFLENRDNNIRYVSLLTLQQVVKVDVKAVQKHRSIIMECLKDTDVSIRKRALDVSCALIGPDNVKTMTKELLNFLLTAEDDFKEDLVMKICMAVDRYPPNKRWQVDAFIKVLCLAGNFVQCEVRDSFLQTISCSTELQRYAATKLYYALANNSNQRRLVEASLWTIGEFADLLVDDKGGGITSDGQENIQLTPTEIVDGVEEVITRRSRMPHSAAPSSSAGGSEVEEIYIHCLLKLTARLPDQTERLQQLLKPYTKHICVELQQRACEYGELLSSAQWNVQRTTLLDRMPVSASAKIKEQERAERLKQLTQEANTGASPRAGDLLDLLQLEPVPPPMSPNAKKGVLDSTTKPSGGGEAELLEDLLGGLSVDSGDNQRHPPPSASSSPAVHVPLLAPPPTDTLNDLFGATTALPAPPPSLPDGSLLFSTTPLEIFNKEGVCVLFYVYKTDPDSPTFTIYAQYSSNQRTVTQFVFEVAVPKYVELNLEAASSSVLQPGSCSWQLIRVNNSMKGSKQPLMKIRISYLPQQASEKVQEYINFSNFPDGV